MVLCNRFSSDYWKKLLKIKTAIEEYFRTERGDEVAVTTEGDGIQILTHKEQADYSQMRARHHIRGYGTAYVKGCAVDLAQLGEAQRAGHERFLQLTAFRLQQMRKRPAPKLCDEPKKLEA